MALTLKRRVNNTDFDVSLIDKVCIFFDDSATGKTYLFDILNQLLQRRGVKSFLFKAENLSVDGKVNDQIFSSDVVFLDSADLYLTQDMYDKLLKSSSMIILSVKSLHEVNYRSYGMYAISYEGDTLKTKRRGILL